MEWTKEYYKMEYLMGIPEGYCISLQHFGKDDAEILLLRGLTILHKDFGKLETMRQIAGEWAIQLRDEFEGRK